jgi:hypothetical protein
MNQRTSWTAGVMIGLLLCATGAHAQKQASQAEVDELKRALDAQEESIRQLKGRINELEGGAPAAAPAEPVLAPVDEEPEITSPAEEMEAKMAAEEGRSPIRYRNNFDDKQEAAPRPEEFLIEKEYRGFIPIPRTVFLVKFNARPRVDMTLDSDNSGNDFRFVPAMIPLEGTPAHGGGASFNANSNGSQLRVDVRAPSLRGNFRVYYQNDFFGSDTANMRYRLQHLYGQGFGLVAGFTYGVFEDPDAWPDTLDYEGPNSVIFARRAVLQYTLSPVKNWAIKFGLEDPDVFIDTTGDPNADRRQRAPDGGFNVRWAAEQLGHVQFSTLLRSIGIDGDLADDDDVLGWGINLAGSLNVTDNDTFQFWGVYGHGVGGMGNDTSFVNSDADIGADGDLKALEYVSGLLAFSHRWTPRWRSTATYGYVNLQNAGMQADDAYDQTHYASLNLVYRIFTRFSVGVEGLYGYRQVKGDAHGDVFRFQASLLYALFD